MKFVRPVVFLFLACLFYDFAQACTTIIVGKRATVDGSIIIARNSDTRAPSRAKHLKIYPPQDLEEVRFLGLPYHDTEAVDGMLQVSTNDNGVAISATETIESSEQTLQVDPYVSTGVEEANVTAPVMRTAKTARHAIELIGKRIETEGSAEGFGIAIADRGEVWYLENASGHHWVAVRVPEDSYLIAANQGRIQEVKFKTDGNYDDGYLGSPGLVDFAKANHLYQERNGRFDFRSTFQSIDDDATHGRSDVYKNYLRIGTVMDMFSGSGYQGFEKGDFPTFVSPIRKLSVKDVAKALSSFYQGTEHDSYTKSGTTQVQRPIAVFNASNSHITVVRDMGPGTLNIPISNVEYIAFGIPTLSLYVPFYNGISQVPHAYQIGNENADDDSAFWKFRKLQTLGFMDFETNQPQIQAAFKRLQKWIALQQEQMESAFEVSHDLQTIQDFTDTIVKVSLEQVDQLRLELEAQHSVQLAKNESPFSWLRKKFSWRSTLPFSNRFYDKKTKQVFDEHRFKGKQ